MEEAFSYPDGIPKEIKNSGPYFCLWTRKFTVVKKDGSVKYDRAPYSTKYYIRVSISEKENLCSYEEAMEAIEENNPDGWGLGFCLGFSETLKTGYMCIDIDDCISLDGNKINIVGNNKVPADVVKEIIQRFHSYTEVSPSGTGIHIFVPCKECDGKGEKRGIEVYYTDRFIRMSGWYISAEHAEMRESDASEDYKWLKENYYYDEDEKVYEAEATASDAVAVSRAKERLLSWLDKNNIKYKHLRGSVDFPVRISVACPWEQNHTKGENGSDSAILITNKGFIIYKCLHGHCADKNWMDYVRFYDKNISFNLAWNMSTVKVWLIKDPKLYLKVFGSVNPVGDYTDQGQAKMFRRIFGDIIAFLNTSEWVCYDGQKWRFYSSRHNVLVKGLSEKLTDIQLYEARQVYSSCNHEVEELDKKGAPKEVEAAAKKKLYFAEEYLKYTKSRRAKDKLDATIDVAQPDCEVFIDKFDNNPYLINTPGGVVDLKNNAVLENDPSLKLSMITEVPVVDKVPDNQVKKWNDFLDEITSYRLELKEYLQYVFGSALVGKVYGEYLYIAYGEGGNGKSTLCNAIASVLGDYVCRLDADYFNANSRHNQLPQLAELRGKRLVIAAETKDGTVLDSGAVKRIASTDHIHAEPKYKTPFDFKPTHTVIIYTSKLPTVKEVDQGTWDRLILIPFETRIRDTPSEIKNYADVLRDECGEAILAWCIEGAKKFLAAGGKIEIPQIVQEAIHKLKRENSNADSFFEDCCYYKKGASVKSSELFAEYKKYCQDDDHHVNDKDFKLVAKKYGYFIKKTNSGNVYMNVGLR